MAHFSVAFCGSEPWIIVDHNEFMRDCCRTPQHFVSIMDSPKMAMHFRRSHLSLLQNIIWVSMLPPPPSKNDKSHPFQGTMNQKWRACLPSSFRGTWHVSFRGVYQNPLRYIKIIYIKCLQGVTKILWYIKRYIKNPLWYIRSPMAKVCKISYIKIPNDMCIYIYTGVS